MPHRGLPHFLSILLCALALAAGCGDDESPTDGGGGGGNTLSVPAGAYRASGTFFDCTTQAVIEAATDTLVFCTTELFDEFFAADCPVRRSGNSLSVSCTRTYEVGVGCEETVVIDVVGTVSGDHYELYGTLTYSDNPPDCWDGAHCDSVYVTLDRIGDAPTACAYADVNTIRLTVSGGPQAGPHTLNAFGSSDNIAGNIQFSFGGFSGPTAAAGVSAPSGINGISLHATTAYLNPAQLPANLTVTVGVPGDRAAAGGPEVVVNYSEGGGYYSFIAESATSGTMVVHELSDGTIAGTLNMTLAGTEYDDQYPQGRSAQRTLTGGYHVTASGGPQATLGGRVSRLLARR